QEHCDDGKRHEPSDSAEHLIKCINELACISVVFRLRGFQVSNRVHPNNDSIFDSLSAPRFVTFIPGAVTSNHMNPMIAVRFGMANVVVAFQRTLRFKEILSGLRTTI